MSNTHLIEQQRKEIDFLQSEIKKLKESFHHIHKSTQSNQSQQIVELIMENSNAILFRRLAATDPKKRKMVYVSPNISRFGYTGEDFLQGNVMFRDLVYQGDSPRTLREIKEYTEQGLIEYTQFYRIVTKQGEKRWVEDRTSVYEDTETGLRYHQGLVIDINDKKVIEEKLKKSEKKYRKIIETTAEGFLMLDNDCLTIDVNQAYEQMVGLSAKQLLGKRPVQLEPGLMSYFNQVKETGTQHHFESELCNIDGKRIPVLLHIGPLFLEGDEPLGAAIFITDISSHKKALLLAAEVQQEFLAVTPPEVSGLSIAGISIPCDEVGGDYYDFFTDEDSKEEVKIVIGDISGHGVDAALLMSSARSYMRATVPQEKSADEVIGSLNRFLTEDMVESGRFMTLFYLTLNNDQKSIEWVRAGHDPALVYDSQTGDFSELKGPGVALGIEPTYVYETQRLKQISSGMIIVLVTDGIWEAVNIDNQEFGKQRLKNIIKEHQEKSSKQIVDNIISEHKTFTEGAVIEDDLTLVVIKVD